MAGWIPAISVGAWFETRASFGREPEGGVALVFTLVGMADMIVAVLAFNSPFYQRLSAQYANGYSRPPQAA